MNTVSRLPVALRSSPRDKLLFQEARSRNGFGLLSFCFDANLPQIKKKRENSTVPPAASPAILLVSQNSRTPPKKSADALRSVADHNAALLCRVWADIVFFRLCSGRAVGRGTKDGGRGTGAGFTALWGCVKPLFRILRPIASVACQKGGFCLCVISTV